MEGSITLFFMICYAVFVFIIMRVLRHSVNPLTRKILIFLFILIPVADSIAGEVLYLVTRNLKTSSAIYSTAMVREFTLIGAPCRVRNQNTSGTANFINEKGFKVRIRSSISLNRLAKNKDIWRLKNELASEVGGYRYVVWSRGDRVINLVYRDKIIYDMQNNVILGESHDVSIIRGFPFFVCAFNPSNVRTSTFKKSDFCNFEYSVLILDRD